MADAKTTDTTAKRAPVDVVSNSSTMLAALEGLRAASQGPSIDSRGEAGVQELTAPETGNPDLGKRIYPVVSRTLAQSRAQTGGIY